MGRNKRLRRLQAFFKKEGEQMSQDKHEWEHGDSFIKSSESTYVPEPPCHKGKIKAFEACGLSFYGGGKHHDLSLVGIDSTWMLLDLADNFPSPIECEGYPFKQLREQMEINRLRIKWPDGGVAPFGKEHWLALCLDLKEWQQQGGKNVIVCCLGGHGRTGTALAILWSLMAGEHDPIKKLRTGYCKKAVESDKQVKYVNEITGLKLTDKGSHEMFTPRLTPSLPLVGGYAGDSYVTGHIKVGQPLVAGSEKKGGEELNWKDATCEVCGGPAVAGYCLGCNRGQRHCTCPV